MLTRSSKQFRCDVTVEDKYTLLVNTLCSDVRGGVPACEFTFVPYYVIVDEVLFTLYALQNHKHCLPRVLAFIHCSVSIQRHLASFAFDIAGPSLSGKMYFRSLLFIWTLNMEESSGGSLAEQSNRQLAWQACDCQSMLFWGWQNWVLTVVTSSNDDFGTVRFVWP
jgi:hypothetical protein